MAYLKAGIEEHIQKRKIYFKKKKTHRKKTFPNNTCISKFPLECLIYPYIPKDAYILSLPLFNKTFYDLLSSWKVTAEATLYGTSFLIWVQREQNEIQV